MKRAPAALMAAFASALALLAAQPAQVPALAGDGPDLISGARKPLRPWQTALYRPAR